jgi:type I restriction enzyme, S subunit
MNLGWPDVALGDVIHHRSEFIAIDDTKTYRRPRVQLHAQGILLRDEVSGALIKTKKQQVARAGELLVAEIDAKVGGFGIVPPELDGAIVSSHYFLFQNQKERLDVRFLGWFIKTSFFRQQVEAQGSTNYAAIRAADVLNYTIPLPPMDEQRRVIARIETIAAKIASARDLRSQATTEADGLLRSILFGDKSAILVPMGSLVRQRPPDVAVQASETYHFAGVYSFGRGVFRGVERQGMQFSYPRLSRLRAGDFIYPKLMAWEGALGVVPESCEGLVVSPEFPVFEVDRTKVIPEVLDVYFRTPSIWPKLSGASTGTNVRRRRLNPADFLNYQMPLPTANTQALLRDTKRRIDAAKQLQAETSAELDAMLPTVLDKAFRGEL